VVTFDPDRLRTRAAELEEELAQPGFWDDQQHAAAVSSEHARVTKRLERYDRLMQEYADAKELAELDESYADDVAASLAPLHRELGRLQEDALFSGEYDGGDAVVSIQADAGGTDAQDWAEILLRMYLRWATDRGF
jgi:peptide chain release factor 2